MVSMYSYYKIYYTLVCHIHIAYFWKKGNFCEPGVAIDFYLRSLSPFFRGDPFGELASRLAQKLYSLVGDRNLTFSCKSSGGWAPFPCPGPSTKT